jgi:hypothetical protein
LVNITFRSAEDILEALKPFNEKYEVSFIITEELIGYDSQNPILLSKATILDNNGVNELFATSIVGVDLQSKRNASSTTIWFCKFLW